MFKVYPQEEEDTTAFEQFRQLDARQRVSKFFLLLRHHEREHQRARAWHKAIALICAVFILYHTYVLIRIYATLERIDNTRPAAAS